MTTMFQPRPSDFVLAKWAEGHPPVIIYVPEAEQARAEDDGVEVILRYTVPEVLEALRHVRHSRGHYD